MLENLMASLGVMLWGMVGIFLIIGIICVVVLLLMKLTNRPKSDDTQQ